MSVAATDSRHPGWPERRATAAAFLASGIGIGAWAAAIPGIKNELGLSNGALSLALLGFAVGAVLAMQLTDKVAQQLGTARGTRLAMLIFAGTLVLPPLAGNLFTIIFAAFALGAAQGVLDVLMNAQASIVERRWGTPIMSSFHAAFSAGGLAGAALGGVLASAGSGLGMDLAALLGAVLASCAWVGLRETRTPAPTGRWLMLPERALMPLAAAALLCMLCEGAMGDWSAVYLATVGGATSGWAATGYAGFSGMMVVGRLAGDRVVDCFGRPRVVGWGASIAAAGLVLAVTWPGPVTATIGFSLVGLGLSNVVPAVYSAAGWRGSTPSAGVSMVATAGYAGFLTGPMAIGAIAQASGLRAGLALLVACVGVVALLAQPARKIFD
jgi:MFS family permease